MIQTVFLDSILDCILFGYFSINRFFEDSLIWALVILKAIGEVVELESLESLGELLGAMVKER